ncbi:unnamed protein product [Parnassius mnemosyne]|uniref:PiggyBac transposable element-derived protein domain-containing protein n=1 Tax=Parnassius mnemosyne TaxID=213953 RepID=A0AAV1LIJ0_9NEOP
MTFKKGREINRGDTEQFVNNGVVIVHWMDNKSVLAASNCTSADDHIFVKRWNKKENAYINVRQPLIITNYNRNMGGVDVLDQSIEYYRTFMKTKKWTLKIMLHFFDLAVANAWRLYKIHCQTAHVHRALFDLLQFKLQVADGLTNTPDLPRPEQDPVENMECLEVQDPENVDPNIPAKRYRPANVPSEAKRHDG